MTIPIRTEWVRELRELRKRASKMEKALKEVQEALEKGLTFFEERKLITLIGKALRVKKEVWQLYQHFPGGPLRLCAQKAVKSRGEFSEFIAATEKKHPLPEGVRWLLVPESSPQFIEGWKEGHKEGT